MPAQNDIWTIHNDRPRDPKVGNDLDGLHIRKTVAGYELTEPNLTHTLATTDALDAPFDFQGVHFKNRQWNLHVSHLPRGANGNGRWELVPKADPGGDPTDGDFTAQAGQGAEEGSASSAYA